jgi:L-threonylcarbamoyladenylate synthase
MCAVRILQADQASIREAATLLQNGKLVAFPTETVYGLGGDATNDRAVSAIYAAKGRPQFNPLIIHVAVPRDLDHLIEWTDTARLLAAHFWPGPLTLVMRRKSDAPISLLASAGLDTLAVRIPSHRVAQELLRTADRPIAAPSANVSGKLSPTTPIHVAESLGNKIDLILAGGKCAIGLESTVVDVMQSTPILLRHGGIALENIEKIVGKICIAGSSVNEIMPASPGMLASHYAPNLPLRLNVNMATAEEVLLTFGPDIFVKGGSARLALSEKGDLVEAAANLFALLRNADQTGAKGIAVMPIPDNGLGAAINDRLRRASIR